MTFPSKAGAWFWYSLIAAICLGLSIMGVEAAIHWRNEEVGGLGGAAAVAASFLIMFVQDDRPRRVYLFLTTPEHEPPPDATPTYRDPVHAIECKVIELQTRVEAMQSSLDQASVLLRRQTWWLMFASVTGTIAWAIGQMVARHFIKTSG